MNIDDIIHNCQGIDELYPSEYGSLPDFSEICTISDFNRIVDSMTGSDPESEEELKKIYIFYVHLRNIGFIDFYMNVRFQFEKQVYRKATAACMLMGFIYVFSSGKSSNENGGSNGGIDSNGIDICEMDYDEKIKRIDFFEDRINRVIRLSSLANDIDGDDDRFGDLNIVTHNMKQLMWSYTKDDFKPILREVR